MSLVWSYSTYRRVYSTCKAYLECTHWSFGVLHAQSTLSTVLYVLWVHAVKWHWERVQRGGRGLLPYYSCCCNLHLPHEPVKMFIVWGEILLFMFSSLIFRSGRKSCSVTTVSAESCSQPASVWLLSPALVFTLILVTLLALHWSDFKVLSWIWIPCVHGLGRICLFVCVLMVCLSRRLL